MTSLGLSLNLGLSSTGNPGAALLTEATARYSASSITTGTEQSLPNLNGTGRAILGSVDGAEVVTDGLRLPGTTGNDAATPSAAALNITGDVALIADLTMTDWSPAGTTYVLGKWQGTTVKQYQLTVTTSGRLLLFYSLDGAVSLSEQSSVVHGITDLTRSQIAAERLSVSGDINFYTRATSSDAWVQLGTTQTGTAGDLFTAAGEVAVGAIYGEATTFDGTVHSASIIDGDLATGTVVASPDFEAAANGTGDVTDAQSNVWSIATTGADANDPVLAPGSGYMWVSGESGNYVSNTSPGSITDGDVYSLIQELRFGTRGGSVQQLAGPTSTRCYVSVTGSTVSVTYTEDGTTTQRANSITGVTGADTARWLETQMDEVNDQIRARISNTDTTVLGSVTWEAWSSWVPTTYAIKAMVTTSPQLFLFGSTTSAAAIGSAYVLVDDVEQTNITFDATDTTGWGITRAASGLKTVIVTQPTILFASGLDVAYPTPPTNEYYYGAAAGGAYAITAGDLEAGTFEGEVVEIFDFDHELTAQEVTDLEAALA